LKNISWRLGKKYFTVQKIGARMLGKVHVVKKGPWLPTFKESFMYNNV
jgi:hypothetical protein